jgi:hypothetical protein
MIAAGDPKKLLEESEDPRVRTFLTRGAAAGRFPASGVRAIDINRSGGG